MSLFTVVFGVGRLLTDLPAGRIADRAPAPLALAAAGTVMGAGSLLLAAASSLAVLLVAAVVLGIASAVANTTGMAFFSHAPGGRRGTSMALFSVALLGGQSLGPAVAGVLSGALGWRATEAIGGGAVIVAAAALGLAVAGARSGPEPARPGADERDAPRRSGGPAAPLSGAQRAALYAVPFAVMFALGAMPQTVVPLLGAHGFGLSAGAIGLTLGLGGLCRLAGSGAGGVAADRFSRKGSLVPGLLLLSGGIALLALRLGPAVFVAAVALLSLGSYGITVAATMVADLGGDGIGRRLGTFRFVGDLGLIAGPLLAGALYDVAGGRASVLATAGLVLLTASVAVALLPETKRLGDESPLLAVG